MDISAILNQELSESVGIKDQKHRIYEPLKSKILQLYYKRLKSNVYAGFEGEVTLINLQCYLPSQTEDSAESRWFW